MIGDEYFQLRAQIGTSLFSLTKLARELEAPDSQLAPLQALQAALREPFFFIALGETGAGKSALLNALFGREFAGGAEFAERIAVFRYGREQTEPAPDGLAVEVQRPHIFLRDFTLVDTPALTRLTAEPALLERYLPAADLVLFVFPVKAGSAGEAWDFLAQIPRDRLRRFVIVIQQCDAVGPDEVLLTVKRLRQVMLKRLSQACPIFTVSALRRTGLEKLERYIDSEVLCSVERRADLCAVCAGAQGVLRGFSEGPQAAHEAAQQAVGQVEELRQALAQRKDHSLRQASGALWSLTQIFEVAQRRGEELLTQRLTLGAMLRHRPDGWETLREETEDRLRESVQRQLQASIEHLHGDLREAWEEHAARLRELHLENPADFSDPTPALATELARTRAARDPAGVTLERLSAGHAAASRRLRRPGLAAAASLVILLGAGLAGHWLVGAAVLAVTAGGTLLAANHFRWNLLDVFRQQLSARRETVLAGIEDLVRQEIENFYHALIAELDPLRAAAAAERAEVAPMLARLQQLHEVFEKSTADIQARNFAPSALPPETAAPRLESPAEA